MIDLINLGNNQIEKHIKYKEQYKSGQIFWGLGIENELYLEFENRKNISKDFFLKNKSRERYSVDYFSNYKKECLEEGLKITLEKMGNNVLNMPIIVNSHTFTKADIYGNHKTLYIKDSPLNPEFKGKTLIDFLSEKDNFFSNQDDFWLFDGDTVEFINKKFYNEKLDNIIKEVESNKKIFIQKLNNIFQEEKIYEQYGKINYMTTNHPFAIVLTNPNNFSMFNNGTIHLNLTLPTKLDSNSMIKNKDLFIKQHKKLIKIIQWLEPLIITVYGSPDPFSTISRYKNKHKFSHCSQRNVISRYIGIGTYNTDTMESGKVLTKPIETLEVSKLDYWWYKLVHKCSAYNSLDQVGLDINFNKHWNHGIEIRFLDHISDEKLLYECFEFIIYLADFVLENKKNDYINPVIDETWNRLVHKTMINGILYNLTWEEKFIFENIFDTKIKKSNIVDVYYELLYFLKHKYNKLYKEVDGDKYILEPIGLFSKHTLNNIKFNTIPLFYQTVINKNTNRDLNDLTNVKTFNKNYDNKIDLIPSFKLDNKNLSKNDLTNVKKIKKNYDNIIDLTTSSELNEYDRLDTYCSEELDDLNDSNILTENSDEKLNKKCCCIM
jgi:hypothetical protein